MNREKFFTDLADVIPADGLLYVQDAYFLVKHAHRTQSRRLTGERYFEHIRRVAYMLAFDYGYNDAQTIALGLLHDVVEDTFTPQSLILKLFGAEMYRDIWILSKELPTFNSITGVVVGRTKITDDLYYESLANGAKRPRLVKGCDRIDNVADLAKWEPARQQKYITETTSRVLPIVKAVDLRMAAEIERRLRNTL